MFQEGGKITPFAAQIPLVKSNYRTRIITQFINHKDDL
nr:MAG TPA: hypothetical protein [Inoviridae sp.]